jgi:hypothetical protein
VELKGTIVFELFSVLVWLFCSLFQFSASETFGRSALKHQDTMTQVDKTVLDAINEKIMTIPWVKTLDQNSQLERIRATTVFPLLPPGQFIYKTIFAEDKFLIVHWLDRTEEVLHRSELRFYISISRQSRCFVSNRSCF